MALSPPSFHHQDNNPGGDPPMKGRQKAAAFYVPNNIDLFAYPKDVRWSIAHLLNLIHMKCCFWKQDDEGFVRLKAAYLRKVIPADQLRSVRSFLTGFYRLKHPDTGETLDPQSEERYPQVIEISPPQQGVQCRGYSIREPYRKTRRIECQDDTINRKIAKLCAREENDL